MTRFTKSISMVALFATALSFSACKKDSKDPAPNNPNNPNSPGEKTISQVKFGSTDYKFTTGAAEVDPETGEYVLVNAAGSDQSGNGIYIYSKTKPTPTAGNEVSLHLGEENYVAFVEYDNKTDDTHVHIYNKPDQVMEAHLVNGKLKFIFTALQETNRDGTTPTDPIELTGTAVE